MRAILPVLKTGGGRSTMLVDLIYFLRLVGSVGQPASGFIHGEIVMQLSSRNYYSDTTGGGRGTGRGMLLFMHMSCPSRPSSPSPSSLSRNISCSVGTCTARQRPILSTGYIWEGDKSQSPGKCHHCENQMIQGSKGHGASSWQHRPTYRFIEI